MKKQSIKLIKFTTLLYCACIIFSCTKPESEKVKMEETKLKGITEILRTVLPVIDPENRALAIQWAQDNLNEMPEFFASSLQLDIDAIADFEPPEDPFREEKVPTAR